MWTLVLAKVARLSEIERVWTLDHVFDACDALAHYNDVATWLRPRPPPPPRKPQGWQG